MTHPTSVLADLPFSDIILCANGTHFFKGIPGQGSALIAAEHFGYEIETCLQTMLTELWDLGKDVPALRYSKDGVHFRVSREQDICSGATWFLRKVAQRVPELEQLDLRPRYIKEWIRSPSMGRGLCLLSGPQACGKTTLASSIVKERLTLFGGHCVTFESPAEMPLSGAHGEHGYCWQTEITSEADLPNHIVRAHMFASPDIIYIGEIKSATAALEALRIALGSPKQVVIATLHGLDIISALKRLLDWTSSTDGNNAAANLAMSLSTLLQLDLQEDANGKRWQEVQECLLLPFHNASLINSVRARIRCNNLAGLSNDLEQMHIRLTRFGLASLFEQEHASW